MSVRIYIASTTGKTEDIAERLHDLISEATSPRDLADVNDASELNSIQE